jgi:CheY-like chemotaxis protein
MKALVVHSKPIEALELSYSLVAAGVQVQYAPSALYAMSLIERDQPDVIVCDAELSDMSGAEFLAIVRVEDIYESIPFILLSNEVGHISDAHAVLPPTVSTATVVHFAQEMVQHKPAQPVLPGFPAPPNNPLDLQPGTTLELSRNEFERLLTESKT